jgi:putative addiction module component (TIGR02574 family)
MNSRLQEILTLPVNERIQLVEEIWDSIAAVPEAIELTEKQAEEIDRRLEDFRKNPTDLVPWDAVRERLRQL